MRTSLLLAALFTLATPALADDPITLTLQSHRFTPNVIRVKANQPAMITMINRDATAEEFDSPDLKVEKVVAGNSRGNIRIRALPPGTYKFTGEYHAATAQGVVIAE